MLVQVKQKKDRLKTKSVLDSGRTSVLPGVYVEGWSEICMEFGPVVEFRSDFRHCQDGAGHHLLARQQCQGRFARSCLRKRSNWVVMATKAASASFATLMQRLPDHVHEEGAESLRPSPDKVWVKVLMRRSEGLKTLPSSEGNVPCQWHRSPVAGSHGRISSSQEHSASRLGTILRVSIPRGINPSGPM